MASSTALCLAMCSRQVPRRLSCWKRGRRPADRAKWHYAISRGTRFELRFSLDGKPIAHFPRLEAWPPTGTYFHDPIPLPQYPFKREIKPKAPTTPKS